MVAFLALLLSPLAASAAIETFEEAVAELERLAAQQPFPATPKRHARTSHFGEVGTIRRQTSLRRRLEAPASARNDCVWVNWQNDNWGKYTCECVDKDDPCFWKKDDNGKFQCVEERACIGKDWLSVWDKPNQDGCVFVNHYEDFPGYTTCECVSPTEECRHPDENGWVLCVLEPWCQGRTQGVWNRNNPASNGGPLRVDDVDVAVMAALSDTNEVVRFWRTQINEVIEQSNDAVNVLRGWGTQIKEYSDQQVDKFQQDVTRGTTKLTEADTIARTSLARLKHMAERVIQDVEYAFDTGPRSEEQRVIKKCMGEMSSELTESKTSLERQKSKVVQAKAIFVDVETQSGQIQAVIARNKQNQEQYFNDKKDELRGWTYGGCSACVITIFFAPLVCPVCFGTGAAVIETQIADMKEELGHTKHAMDDLHQHFGEIKAMVHDLGTEADTSITMIDGAKERIETVYNLVDGNTRTYAWAIIGDQKGPIILYLESLIGCVNVKLGPTPANECPVVSLLR